MAASSPPRRRFLPEPVETSTRSSKRPHSEDPAHTSHVRFTTAKVEPHTPADPASTTIKPRHFLPQPIEESTTSSRKSRPQHIEDTQKQASDLTKSHQAAPTIATSAQIQGQDTGPSKTSARRVGPEPVETSARSSRKKFAPEPVETSTRSSRDKKHKEPSESSPAARRRFLPQPVETSSIRRRRRQPPKKDDDDEEDQRGSSGEDTVPLTPSRTSSSGRRFAPELIETAKGSYRRSQHSSGSSSPKEQDSSSPARQPPSVADETTDAVPEIEESRFSSANLAKRQHEVHRQHSFRIPDLPIIESDEGDESSPDTPSLSETPSDSSASVDILQTRRIHHSDQTYTDYVLQLAARKELQDQAMAAYINERPHEPVDHFAIDDDGDDDGPIHVGKLSVEHGIDVRTFRRESAADMDWELENMRRHHAQLEQMKRDFKENTAGQSRFSAAALVSRQHQHHVNGKKTKVKKGLASFDSQEDDELAELKRMRSAASPPMLGDDIVFPMTISPKMTRCDVDQIPRPRTADDDEEREIEGDPGLWTSNPNVSNRNSVGLWMGMCQKTSSNVDNTRPPTPMRSGIQTPAYELRNPFEAATPGRPGTPGGAKTPRRGGKHLGMFGWLPLTPPRDREREKHEDDGFTASVDKKLNLERQIEEEFPNKVVTQIYNYLSLGYPILARPFDEELSKISRIPVEELRKDDLATDAKGHVGAPEGDGVDDEFVERGKCRRWEALRFYVKEWARQSPQFKEEVGRVKGGVDWGLAGNRVRRGSWAH